MKVTVSSYKKDANGNYVYFNTSHGYYDKPEDYLGYLMGKYPNDHWKVEIGEAPVGASLPVKNTPVQSTPLPSFDPFSKLTPDMKLGLGVILALIALYIVFKDAKK